jgi:outer membrane protein OmpA-like peptidoglycan-associated protein
MRRLAFLLLLFCLCGGTVCAADQSVRRFIVYFPEWSAALDDAAQAVISQATDLAKTRAHPVVSVTGFADPTGSKEANILLSELRARRVADLLQQGGVTVRSIHPIGRGSVKFTMVSQESRRVEIAVDGR